MMIIFRSMSAPASVVGHPWCWLVLAWVLDNNPDFQPMGAPAAGRPSRPSGCCPHGQKTWRPAAGAPIGRTTRNGRCLWSAVRVRTRPVL